jgi:hypothetical protein
MEKLLSEKHYNCKAITGLRNNCKSILGFN